MAPRRSNLRFQLTHVQPSIPADAACGSIPADARVTRRQNSRMQLAAARIAECEADPS